MADLKPAWGGASAGAAEPSTTPNVVADKKDDKSEDADIPALSEGSDSDSSMDSDDEMPLTERLARAKASKMPETKSFGQETRRGRSTNMKLRGKP